MPTYIGRDDLHFCITQQQLVFLDATADSYMCLDRAGTAAVLPLIDSCNTRLILRCDHLPREAQSTVDSMVQRGLLVESPDVSWMRSDRYERGLRPLRALRRFARPRAHQMCLPDFLFASISASLQLRFRPLGSMLDAIRFRKRACTFDASLASESDVAQLVERFDGLRPMYPRRYLCLFDSLALLEWLLRHGIVARWVFGVRAEPFAAHCWLQIDDLVLNEALDHAREFEPIMVI